MVLSMSRIIKLITFDCKILQYNCFLLGIEELELVQFPLGIKERYLISLVLLVFNLIVARMIILF